MTSPAPRPSPGWSPSTRTSAGAGDALERLTTALTDANQDLRDRVAAEPGLHGMGTTVTALLNSDGKLALAHIGDSRAYLLRDGRLSQITHDHTFVQSLVDDGRLTEEEARSHPQRNLITRVLTGEREDTPDLSVREARPGDTYLLCSDGLTGVVTEETLTEVLGNGQSVATRAETLIDLALKGGSSDNVTCVVADVVDLDVDEGPPTAPEVVGAAALHQATTTAADTATPAGKAAALAREATAPEKGEKDVPVAAADEPRPKRHKGMLFVLLVLVIALVLGGGYGAYAWSQRQYFVGADAGNIAIYKGLPQDVGPVHLSSVYERQDLPVDQLPSYWRDQVQQRITASTLSKARQVVSNLRDQAAVCASSTATPTGTPTTTPNTTPQHDGRPDAFRHSHGTGGRQRDRDDEPGDQPERRADRQLDDVSRRHSGRHRVRCRLMSMVIPVAPRSRRGVELVLLLMAIAIVLLAYAAVGLAMQDQVPPDLVYYGAGLVVLSGGLHVLLRLKAKYADPVLLPAATLLNGLGLVMIHRLDLAHPLSRSGGNAYAFRQLIWSAIGVLGAVAVIWLVNDHRVLRRFTYIAMLAGLGLLLLPLVPGLGRTINGSRIWIVVGPLSFQPGEIAKIALTVFFAGYLVTHRDVLSLVGRQFLGVNLPRARDLGPIVVAWLASLGVLVFEHDLGSSLLFFGLFVAMLYVATERRSWIAIGLILFCAGSYAAYLMFGHVQDRVAIWLHAFDPAVLNKPFGGSYQVVQGLYGMAAGGMFGTGLGQGHPQMHPVRRERLHRAGVRRGARARRSLRPAADLRPDRRARPAHLDRRP